MKFSLTREQLGFAHSLDQLLSGASVPATVRAWAAGDPGPGQQLWSRLAELGVCSLAYPETGATTADLVVAFEQLGRHAVPGPWIESAVLVPSLIGGEASDEMVTAAVPLALDADIAARVYMLDMDQVRLATVGERRVSIDPARRLFTVKPGDVVGDASPKVAARALDLATLAAAAQLVGAGLHVLDKTVEYTKERTQFGKPIGSFQAVKHMLADAKVGLDFARPMVWGASITEDPVDVSAAKVAAGEAAYAASRAALQAHGAIGYTAEYDLSVWLLRIRALRGAWGTPSYHRGRVLSLLTSSDRVV